MTDKENTKATSNKDELHSLGRLPNKEAEEYSRLHKKYGGEDPFSVLERSRAALWYEISTYTTIEGFPGVSTYKSQIERRSWVRGGKELIIYRTFEPGSCSIPLDEATEDETGLSVYSTCRISSVEEFREHWKNLFCDNGDLKMTKKKNSLIRWWYTDEFNALAIEAVDRAQTGRETEYTIEEVEALLEKYIAHEINMDYASKFSDAEIYELVNNFDTSEHALMQVQVHRIPLSNYMSSAQAFSYVKRFLSQGEDEDEEWTEYRRLYCKYEGEDPTVESFPEPVDTESLWYRISVFSQREGLSAQVDIDSEGEEYLRWTWNGVTLIVTKTGDSDVLTASVFSSGPDIESIDIPIKFLDQFRRLWNFLDFNKVGKESPHEL